jgi:hypothetical protein
MESNAWYVIVFYTYEIVLKCQNCKVSQHKVLQSAAKNTTKYLKVPQSTTEYKVSLITTALCNICIDAN